MKLARLRVRFSILLLYGVSACTSQTYACGSSKSDSSSTVTVIITQFGAKGNGIDDDTKAIQKAVDYVEAAGGGTVIVPASSKGYLLYDNILLGDNVTIAWKGKGFFKLKKATRTGAVLTTKSTINKSISQNIVIVNPYIDANNIKNAKYGENGIGIGHARNIKISGGVVKGARRATTFGGKGICVELGVQSCSISNTTILNSDIAFFVHGVNGTDKLNRDLVARNIKLSSITAKNCGTFLQFVCSYDPPPVDSSITQCSVDGFTVENCGKTNGVILLDRYSFVNILNGRITNSAQYGQVEAVVRGRSANLNIRNVRFNGVANSLISTSIIPRGGKGIGAVNWNINDMEVSGGNTQFVIASSSDNVWKNSRLRNINLGNSAPVFEKKAAAAPPSRTLQRAAKTVNPISRKGAQYYVKEILLNN